MAFVPVIDFRLIKDSNDVYQLHVDDTTDVYDATDNATGWEDASTLLGSNVTVATLAITDPAGTITTINVLSQIPSTVTGTIDFTAIDSNDGVTVKDGYYKVLYTLSDGSTTWTDCVEKYFYPNIKCCISKMVNMLRDDPTNSSLIDDVTKVKAWEHVLCSAASTVDKSTADTYVALLNDYCDYNDCNCKSK